MTETTDAVAFLLEESELAQIFIDWPEEMRLAVCLDADGGCAMLVHHAREDDRILDRAASVLGTLPGGFAVVPRREGHPTRRMLFSEEQRLLALVAETDGLVETASDYALNYAFAAEEGLDIERLTAGGESAPANRALGAVRWLEVPDFGPVPAETVPEPDEEPLPRFLRDERVADRPWQRAAEEDFAFASRAPDLPAPMGFRRLNDDLRGCSLFTDGMLALGRSGKVWLTVGRHQVAPEALRTVDVETLYFRDDLLTFAVPFAAIGGAPEGPLRLIFDEALFPRRMVEALEHLPQAVRLSAVGGYLYAAFAPARMPLTAPAPPRLEAIRPASPAPVAPMRRLRRFLGGGFGGVAVFLMMVLVLQLGLSPAFSRADRQDQQIDSLRDAVFGAVAQK